jgi:hypothetical protein
MARIYNPKYQKPAQNKRESGPKEKKGTNSASKEKEDAGK